MCSREPLPSDAKENFLTAAEGPADKVLNLERYATYFFTAIANQLSSGASRAYLQKFDIGIVEWRVIAMLAIEPGATAARICEVVGLDKSAVSKAVGTLSAKGHVASSAAGRHERRRYLELTPAGYDLHNRVIDIAIDRENRLLRGLDPEEVDTLIDLLARVLANAPDLNAPDLNAPDAEDAMNEKAASATREKTPRRRGARRSPR